MLLLFLTPQFGQQITDKSCLLCHSPEGWIPLSISSSFNHSLTAFPLDGEHAQAECIQCHTGITLEELHEFSNASTECVSCHLDIHFGSFDNDCQRCHSSKSWEMATWGEAHETTLFSLTGAHAQINCTECHGANFSWLSGTLTTECSACHLNVYTLNPVHTGNTDCLLCHNTRAWIPSDMSHHDAIFPIYSGKHRGEWPSCETCHTNPDDYTDFSCGLNGVCHEHEKNDMDDKHYGEVSGYIYESQSCYNCHPNGTEDD